MNLGRKLAKNTVKNILLRNGIDPSPDRKGSWTTFLRAHLESTAAMDFFTTEVWTSSGLTTFYTLVCPGYRDSQNEKRGIHATTRRRVHPEQGT